MSQLIMKEGSLPTKSFLEDNVLHEFRYYLKGSSLDDQAYLRFNKNFVGIVEKVGVEEKKGFTNLDELWTILNCGAVDSYEETIPPL
jgi:hypothetical protein